MSRPSATAARRRGTILVVVLALLAIFAVIGIAFVFYSDGEMTAARYHRESLTRNGLRLPSPPAFDQDAELALASVIFGADPTDPNAQLNALRGHDLLTGIYGAYGKRSDDTSKFSAPYSGPGIIHEDLSKLTDTSFKAVGDRAHVVNHTVMNVGGKYLTFEPEISGEPRDVTATAPIKLDDSSITGKDSSGNTVPVTRYYVPKNAPYTYPDLNNFHLASISPATGEVLVPSFFRPWHFNAKPVQPTGSPFTTPIAAAPLDRRLAPWDPNDGTLIANTDWVTAEGKARILRPRPIDQLTGGEISAATGGKYNRPPTEAELATLSYGEWKALYKAIDDRIRDLADPILGYPRPNQDGGTTGDVFSFIGGVGVQRNDSILIDFGATPIEWPPGSGKYIKPLAAVLATDADGLLDLNAHGNVRDAGSHVSYHGMGPWEVNLAAATANTGEADGLVKARYGSTAAAKALDKTTDLHFDPSKRRLGTYGQVNWDAAGTIAMGSKAILLPSFAKGANPFAVVPNYEAGFFDDNTSTTKGTDHPSLYNPSDAAPFPEGVGLNPLPAPSPSPAGYTVQQYGFGFAASDTRRLRQRYAGELDLYQQMTFNRLVTPPSGTLIGSFNAGSGYSKDPAHPRRLLFTTLSAGLDLPGTMPQGQDGDAAKALSLKAATAPFPPTPPAQVHPTNTGLLAGKSWAYAGLGPVDLNRPLKDYRDDTSKSLDPTTVSAATANKAWADRHNLARDIFIRLACGTSAKGIDFDSNNNLKLPDPDPAVTPPEQYNALRYLAQVAVNIVDYIDGDDISTQFVWNPEDSSNAPKGLLTVVDESSVVSTATTAMADQDTRNKRVVFGVEVPRLVINEVYAEAVDDPNGKGKSTKKKGGGSSDEGVVRFWVELVNPTTPASPAMAKDGPLGTGVVNLKYTGGIKPYKLTITRAKKGADNVGDDIRYNPANVAGDPTKVNGNTFTPDIDYDFDDAGTGAVKNNEIEPNNGKYDAGGDPAKGFVVVGPKVTGAVAAQEYDPKALPTPPTWVTSMIETPGPTPAAGTTATKGLEYLMTNAELKAFDPTKATDDFRRHVVLLRRLANPYLAADDKTNPFVTVDVMDYVPANDAVLTGTGGGAGGGGALMTDRFAVGRVQPYAGHAAPDAAMAGSGPKYTFPTSCLLAQLTSPGANEPKHTFGRHNGATSTAPTEATVIPAPANAGESTAVTGIAEKDATMASVPTTIMAPFDWLTHLDRPLVNQLELLHLQAVKPHEVTYYFIQPPTAAMEPIRRQVGQAPWLGVVETSATAPQAPGAPYTIKGQGRSGIDTNAQSVNALYRGLEYLRVKPWTYGAASGGRVHGRINLNTVQDIRIWTALTDAQDSRKASGFTTPETDALWTALFTSPTTGGTSNSHVRTYTSAKKTDAINQNWTVPVPGETVDDANPFADPDPTKYADRLKTLDRPFKPFGVVDAPAPPAMAPWTPPMVAPAGSGLQDTFLRADPNAKANTTNLPTNPNLPMLWSNTQTHPYLESELPRKLVNNTTTVSNVFCVYVTIVYHEVRPAAPEQITAMKSDGTTTTLRRHYLGREAFREVPGDMRQQYLAIVDRSNAVVKAGDDSRTDQSLVKTPFYAALTDGVKAGDTALKLTNASTDSTNTTVLVYADGQPVSITATAPNNQLVIGSGIEAELVTVSSVAANGVVNLSAGLARPHAPGAVVTNASTGRPTQPGTEFNPIQFPGSFRYPLLIPYAARVR